MQFTSGFIKKQSGTIVKEKSKLAPSKNSSLLKVSKNRPSNNKMATTPGDEESKEDLEGFKHEYYELSVKMIDLLLLGKE